MDFEKMLKIINWLKRFAIWVLEIKHELIFLAVMGSAFAFLLSGVSTEKDVRFVGLILQAVGMVYAIWGLYDTHSHFKKGGVFAFYKDWLKRFPKKGSVIIGVSTGNIDFDTMAGFATTWANDDPEKSLNERIERIYKNLEQLHKDDAKIRQDLTELDKKHEKETKATNEKTEALEKSLREEMEVVHTSGMVESILGLFYILVGIIFATIPTEIAAII